MRNTRRGPRYALALLRAVGGGAFALPQLGSTQFGLQVDAHSNYLVRLFAARNIALAAGLLASRDRERELWWQVGIACDALDAGAGVLAMRQGKARHSGLVDVGASLLATGLGCAGLLAEAKR
jgi:hypothetical protein